MRSCEHSHAVFAVPSRRDPSAAATAAPVEAAGGSSFSIDLHRGFGVVDEFGRVDIGVRVADCSGDGTAASSIR